MKQKLKFGLGIFFCGAMTLAGVSAAFETGKPIDLILAAVFLALTVILILKWPGRKPKSPPKAKSQPAASRSSKAQPMKPQVPNAEIYVRSMDTEDDITASGAPFSYLDAQALKFWNHKTTDFQVPSYYAGSAFGRNVKPALNRLLTKKYLTVSGVEKSIELKKVPELKELLAARGLKVSGKKAELIQRLSDNVSKAELETMFPARVYEITDKGQDALQYYSIIFASEDHNLTFSFYRLLKEKAACANLSDEEILLQLLFQDLDKAKQNGEHEGYRVTAERTARFLEATGKIKKAFGFYCASFFMFWYRNTVELGVDDPTEAYEYPAKSIERCGQLCGYSLQEALKIFRESLQEINPFGLGTKHNIDLAVKAFKEALSV